MLNIYDFELDSEIYGPGKRMVIWMQGCMVRCKGCWNKEMWSMEPNQLYTVDKLFKMVKTQETIEGITLLGGEPLHQSGQLFEFCTKIKNIGLSVMLFTGFEIKEIEDENQTRLLELADIIVSGRYIEEERNIYLQWRGSENQKVIFNTDKYKGYEAKEGNYCEITIDKSGSFTLSGFPEEDLLEELYKIYSGSDD